MADKQNTPKSPPKTVKKPPIPRRVVQPKLKTPSPPAVPKEEDPGYQDDFLEDPDLPALPLSTFPPADELESVLRTAYVPEISDVLNPEDQSHSVEEWVEATPTTELPEVVPERSTTETPVDASVQVGEDLLPGDAISIASDVDHLRDDNVVLRTEQRILNDRIKSLEEMMAALRGDITDVATAVQSLAQEIKRVTQVESAIVGQAVREAEQVLSTQPEVTTEMIAGDDTLTKLREQLIGEKDKPLVQQTTQYPKKKKRVI